MDCQSRSMSSRVTCASKAASKTRRATTFWTVCNVVIVFKIYTVRSKSLTPLWLVLSMVAVNIVVSVWLSYMDKRRSRVWGDDGERRWQFWIIEGACTTRDIELRSAVQFNMSLYRDAECNASKLGATDTVIVNSVCQSCWSMYLSSQLAVLFYGSCVFSIYF